MPTIDLSKIHKGAPDVVVDVKPLITFDHTGSDLIKSFDQIKDIDSSVKGFGSDVR